MLMPYLTKRIPVVIQLKKFEADLFFIQFPDVYIEKNPHHNGKSSTK
jgi:hypothetical protein